MEILAVAAIGLPFVLALVAAFAVAKLFFRVVMLPVKVIVSMVGALLLGILVVAAVVAVPALLVAGIVMLAIAALAAIVFAVGALLAAAL